MEFYSKNKSEKIVYLVGFIIRMIEGLNVNEMRPLQYVLQKYSA